jgi:hypothetical protein
MTPCNKEVVPAVRAPVLSAVVLARVHELNRDYVELLATPALAHDADTESLPAKVLDALLHLPNASRLRLAATPFALYSLGFEDQQFWRCVLDDARVADREDPPLQERYGVMSAPPAGTLCEVALFFAWHTAVSNRVAARVLFAMSDELAERMVRTPLWKLRHIATEFPGLLTPRWPTNPGFWPDLVRFAAAADWRRLETAQLLGSQLNAIELDTAADPDGKALGNRRRIDMTRARSRMPP